MALPNNPGLKSSFQQSLPLWCLCLLGVCGIFLYFVKAPDVFPSASIELKLQRAEILAKAEKWAHLTGYADSGAIKSTIFSFDETSKTFLEYELGLPKANSLMKNQIPVWYWSTRMVRPLDQEGFSAAISPSGRLVSFEHNLQNDRALPTISHDQARNLAISFIENEVKLPISTYKSVEDGLVSQIHRADHYFTFEDKKESYKGAKLRIYVYIAGNKVSSFNQFLYIPETWLRKFSELRSYNKALEDVASIFYVIFNTATSFAFLWVFSSGMLRWRLALYIAGLIGVVNLVEALNSMPSLIHNYTATMTYGSYILQCLTSSVWDAIGQILSCFILVGSAERLYRMFYPNKISLEGIFSQLGLRTRQVIVGLTAGHGMFGVHLGWIILYYVLGQNFGLWSPLEVKNVEGLSDFFPFFSAMYIGTTAAIFEELTYRIFGMCIFQRLVKSFWLANCLQAAAWAFMHSNYPQEPPWARGAELTVVGIFYGFMLRRYGILACIVSHFVFDTFLGVTPLLSSIQPVLQVTAVVAFAPFLVILFYALYQVLKNGLHQDEQQLSNASIQPYAVKEEIKELFPDQRFAYKALSLRARCLLIFACILALIIQFGYFFPVVGQEASLTITRENALAKARQVVSDNKLSPDRKLSVTWLTKGVNSLAMQYLFEKIKFKDTEKLSLLATHPLIWQVRFFEPLKTEEYLVSLDGSGRFLSLSVVLPEDKSGAHLSESRARTIAENFLTTVHPELLPYVFDDASKQERQNRRDWTFGFKIPKFKVADSDFKATVTVSGNIISEFDEDWELPDKWLWERSRQHLKDQVCGYLVSIMWACLGIATIWWVIGIARSGAIRWRPAILIALLTSLLAIPQALNDLPEFFVGYGTDTPLVSFFIKQGLSRQLLTAISSFASVLAMSAFGFASFRILFPRLSIVTIIKGALIVDTTDDARLKRTLWLDAVLVGFAVGIGRRAFDVLISSLHSFISPEVSLAPLDSFCNLSNVASPALDAILDALSHGLSSLLISGLCVGLYAKYFKSLRSYVLFSLFVSLIGHLTDRYWQDYLLAVTSDLVYMLGAWLLVTKLARQNIYAYFLIGATFLISGDIRALMAHGFSLYQRDVVILILVLFSPIIYLLMLSNNPRGKSPLLDNQPEAS